MAKNTGVAHYQIVRGFSAPDSDGDIVVCEIGDVLTAADLTRLIGADLVANYEEKGKIRVYTGALANPGGPLPPVSG